MMEMVSIRRWEKSFATYSWGRHRDDGGRDCSDGRASIVL